MKRKIIVSFIILLSLFLITGCGKKKEEAKQEETSNQEQTNNQEDTKKPNDSIEKIQTIGDIMFQITEIKYKEGNSVLNYAYGTKSEESQILNSYTIKIYNGEKVVKIINNSIGENNVIEKDKARAVTKNLENFDITKATAIVFEINDSNE